MKKINKKSKAKADIGNDTKVDSLCTLDKNKVAAKIEEPEIEANARIDDLLERFYDEETPMQLMTGFDDCIEGVMVRYGMQPIICYNYEKVIQKLMKDMPREEAEEFFQYNQLGAWVGEGTPCFIVKE